MSQQTSSSGMPIHFNEKRDQILENHLLTEKLAYFNREKIPERITHAKGAGAYGVFTVTSDLKQYTKENRMKSRVKIFIWEKPLVFLMQSREVFLLPEKLLNLTLELLH
jgi:catalase